MEIISEKISKSKSLHIGIFGSTPYGDYLLLKEEYKKQDEDIIKSSWWYIVNYHETYLRKIKKKHKHLTCVYCGKSNLIVDSKQNFTLATVDHFYPSSKGGDRFDTDNFVVSCWKCNMRKGDKIYLHDSLKYINLYGDKLELIKNYEKKFPMFGN